MLPQTWGATYVAVLAGVEIGLHPVGVRPAAAHEANLPTQHTATVTNPGTAALESSQCAQTGNKLDGRRSPYLDVRVVLLGCGAQESAVVTARASQRALALEQPLPVEIETRQQNLG